MQLGQNDNNLMEVIKNVENSYITKHNVLNSSNVTRKGSVDYKVLFSTKDITDLSKKTLEEQTAFVAERLLQAYYGTPLLEVLRNSISAREGSIESHYRELARRVGLWPNIR